MKNFWQSIVLIGSVAMISHSQEVFNFSYDNFNILLQNGAVLNPDATMVSDPVKCFDMGQTGTVEIPNVAIPQGPFSIESRFYLNGFNETDPNISEIAAAFDCGNGTEGVDFRVGGGYNYALKIQDLYTTYSDWTRPDESEKAARAAISKSMGELSIGSGQGAWKEIFTDRCIDLKKWVHMVATWDGSQMLLYINGHNATDGWRTVGVGLPANIAPQRAIMIGAETVAAWRHLNGRIGYVKIFDKALLPAEVWQQYRASLAGEHCTNFIKMESPRCGEVISRDTKIKFCVKDSMDNDITPSGQTYTIQICGEPTFTNGVRNYSTTATDCGVGDLVGTDNGNFDGLLYFRISACNGGELSKMAVDNVSAESGTLPTFFAGSSTSNASPAIAKILYNATSKNHGVIFDILGRRVGGGTASSLLKHGICLIKNANGVVQKTAYMK